MTQLSKTEKGGAKLAVATTPRVLVVVSGGIADPVFDVGVDVVVFDRDNYKDDPKGTGGVPGHFADLAGPIGVPVDEAELVEAKNNFMLVDRLGDIEASSQWLDGNGGPFVDGTTLIERKAAGADEATRFMQELLDSVETLGGIAEVHGVRTLTDLMHLQSAILRGSFIDSYPDESAAMDIATSLPSGERWAKFVRVVMDLPS